MKKTFFIITIVFLYNIPMIAQNGSKLDKNLIAVLDTIYNIDQNQLNEVHRLQDKFGIGSPEAKVASEVFDKNHIINLRKIENILNKRGWLGADIVGDQGNRTLFLIIQHSELEIQLKYLPMMQEAAKKGDVAPIDLAYVEDRIRSKQGKTQIYGSQIKYYPETKILDVWPIEDPEKIDEKRAAIGLRPIKVHLKDVFNLDWNLEKQIERTKKFKSNIAKKQ